MTQALLNDQPPARVLEIGTGSAYQTVILAQLVEQVFSVERISDLLQRARRRVRELGLRNVRLKHTDGSWGWQEHGPYDGILVTAAPPAVPRSLCEQLAPGGRMIIPVGAGGRQQLLAITHTASGYEVEQLDMVCFVPLLGGIG
jgi:protein-L-isoaspartate(D-aspartate) O-methyltransferase